MASVLAKYEFDDRKSAEAAFDRIRSEVGAGIDRSGETIEITSDCNDPRKAGQICASYGGEPK